MPTEAEILAAAAALSSQNVLSQGSDYAAPDHLYRSLAIDVLEAAERERNIAFDQRLRLLSMIQGGLMKDRPDLVVRLIGFIEENTCLPRLEGE